MRGINSHLLSEPWAMLALFLLPLIFGFVAVIGLPYSAQQLNLDRCLDAGGSYNYAAHTCEQSDALTSPRSLSPSIERTSSGRILLPAAPAHIER